MNISRNEPESKQAACLAAAQQLAGRFDWHLLAEADWASQAANICATATEKETFGACLNVYSRALYDACRDSLDALRQTQAYTELHYYLFQKARRLCPARLVEDATQTALVLVFEKIKDCQKPEWFLLWAWNWLRAAIKSLSAPYRHEEPLIIKENDPMAMDDDLWDDAAWVVDEINEILEEPQIIDDLRDCIRQTLQQQPRARRQMCALLWKYFDDLDAQETAAILDTSDGAVYRLRNSAIKKLRECLERKGHRASSPIREV